MKDQDLIAFLILTDGASAPSYSATITPPGGTIYSSELNTFTATTDVPSPVYTWTVGSGVTIVSGQGTASVVVRFDQAGSRSVSLAVTGGGAANATWAGTVAQWTPARLTGLVQWLDGGDAAVMTLDGSNNISQWSDKSGTGRHEIQGTATTRPSYTSANQINGITVPYFDGADDTMSTSGGTTINQPNTIYTVFRLGSGSSSPQLFDGSSARQYVYFPSMTSVQAYANSVLTPTITSVVGTVSQIGVAFNGASSTFRLNRAQIASGNLGASGIGPEIIIGSNRFGAGLFKGPISEHVIYSRILATTERDTLEHYFSARWGTP